MTLGVGTGCRGRVITLFSLINTGSYNQNGVNTHSVGVGIRV